jgi:hypothetical protein
MIRLVISYAALGCLILAALIVVAETITLPPATITYEGQSNGAGHCKISPGFCPAPDPIFGMEEGRHP